MQLPELYRTPLRPDHPSQSIRRNSLWKNCSVSVEKKIKNKPYPLDPLTQMSRVQRVDIQLFGNHCQRLFGQVFIGESCIRIKCEIPQDFFGRLFIALLIERERLVDEQHAFGFGIWICSQTFFDRVQFL